MNKKVFISSTCYDLIDIRSELKEFLDEIGLIPILSDHNMSEFSTEYNSNSIEICLANLRDCDTVIFVLCQRYGPSLEKAGFGDFSATHLEYLEARKLGKKILFFVRDRFLADYNTYRKTKNIKSLSWLNKDIDLRLFEIFEDWKLLSPADTNNWFGTFRNSVELKQRLRIELKDQVNMQRLDKLIESGNTPLLTVSTKPKIVPNTQDKEVHLAFEIQNFGNQVAIETTFLLYNADSYEEVLEQELLKKYSVVELRVMGSLSPLSKKEFSFNVKIEEEKLQKRWATFIVEVVYTTIYGDSIADVSKVGLMFSPGPKVEVLALTNFEAKRYRSSNDFKRLTNLKSKTANQ